MLIYLVKRSSGSYEDYREWIDSAYFKEEDAIHKKHEINKSIDDKNKFAMEQYEKCKKCMWLDTLVENKEEEEKFRKSIKDYCQLGEFEFDYSDGNVCCLYSISFPEEHHCAKIEKIEVI